jgi:hypothetical protein
MIIFIKNLIKSSRFTLIFEGNIIKCSIEILMNATSVAGCCSYQRNLGRSILQQPSNQVDAEKKLGIILKKKFEKV